MKLTVTLNAASESALLTQYVRKSISRVLYDNYNTDTIRNIAENFAELPTVYFRRPAEIFNRDIGRSPFHNKETENLVIYKYLKRYYTAKRLLTDSTNRPNGWRDDHLYVTSPRTRINDSFSNRITVRKGNYEYITILTNGYWNGISLSKTGFNATDTVYYSEYIYGRPDSKKKHFRPKSHIPSGNINHSPFLGSKLGKKTGTIPIVLKADNTAGMGKNGKSYSAQREKVYCEVLADYATDNAYIIALRKEREGDEKSGDNTHKNG